MGVVSRIDHSERYYYLDKEVFIIHLFNLINCLLHSSTYNILRVRADYAVSYTSIKF